MSADTASDAASTVFRAFPPGYGSRSCLRPPVRDRGPFHISEGPRRLLPWPEAERGSLGTAGMLCREGWAWGERLPRQCGDDVRGSRGSARGNARGGSQRGEELRGQLWRGGARREHGRREHG